MTEDVQGWIERTKMIELIRHDKQCLSDEDERRLAQIVQWCRQSSLLWEIVARIGWEINES